MANITVPDGVAVLFADEHSGDEIPRWAMEAILVEAVREGRVSRGYFRETLGLEFTESEALLASKGVFYTMTAEELDRDLELAKLGGKAP